MKKQNRGFSLIEVMVALLILAIAVLGFIALQGQALKATDESLERTQTLVMMRSMGEKIRANPTAMTSYQSAINTPATTAPTKGCGLFGSDTSSCNPTELATAEAFTFTQDMSNYGFTVNLVPCPSTGGGATTNVMYSWCLISAWGDTTPTVGTDNSSNDADGNMDCLTSQVTNSDGSITNGGQYHSGATCMFMEVT